MSAPHMLSIAPVFLTLALSAMPQAATPAPAAPAPTIILVPPADKPATDIASPASTPEYGPTHIVSAPLKISFDLPEGMQFRIDVARRINAKFVKNSDTGDPCVHLETLANDPKLARRFFFYRYNGDCFSQPASQESVRRMARTLLTAMLHNDGKESITSPIDYDLDHHVAAVVNGSVYAEKYHGLVFGESTCILIEKDVACFSFLDSTASKTARLAALPLTFEGHTPTPVIPLDMSAFVTLPTQTFHDEQRHIEFTYPGTFVNSIVRIQDGMKQKAEEATDKQKKAMACVRTLLGADDLEDDSRSNVMIFSAQSDCLGIKPDPRYLFLFAAGLADGMSKSGPTNLPKPTNYTIDNKDAVLLQGTITAKGELRYISDSCTIISQDFVCFQTSSTSPEALHKLQSSTLSLSGGTGTPLVPENLRLNMVIVHPGLTTTPAK